MAAGEAVSVHSAPDWIESNRSDFDPPVCNKCMFEGQLFVFFVGGPNQRMDFHLENGEELFYQVEGDMNLKVIERGHLRDIPIKQGEIFLLPGRIEHCPQRPAGTVGCVIERARKKEELDCLRYYDDKVEHVQWEKWFHLKDVVKDLPPIMKEFRERQASGPSPSDEPQLACAFQPDPKVSLAAPILIPSFLDRHLDDINSKSPYQLYGPPLYKSLVLLYGQGHHQISSKACGDMVVMTLRGEVSLKSTLDNAPHKLAPFTMARIKPNTTCNLDVSNGSVCITVQMD